MRKRYTQNIKYLPLRCNTAMSFSKHIPCVKLAAFTLVLAAVTPVFADDFVFDYDPSGLEIKAQVGQEDSFVTNYGPGGVVLQYKSEQNVANVEIKPHPGKRVPSPRVASTKIQSVIEETAFRYAGNAGLRQAGLSVTEWLALFKVNIEIESGYSQKAVSKTGAIGLGQLMPKTAALLGVNPHDFRQNLDGSARYLLGLLKQFGSKELALAGYNAGPNAVVRYGGIPPYTETQGHVRKVMGVYRRFTNKNRKLNVHEKYDQRRASARHQPIWF